MVKAEAQPGGAAGTQQPRPIDMDTAHTTLQLAQHNDIPTGPKTPTSISSPTAFPPLKDFHDQDPT